MNRFSFRSRALIAVLAAALSLFALGLALAQEGILRYDEPVEGTIDDETWTHDYAFIGAAGETVVFLMEATSGDLSPFILVWTDRSEQWIAGDFSLDGRTAALTVTLPDDDIYQVIATRARQNYGLTSGGYRLTATLGAAAAEAETIITDASGAEMVLVKAGDFLMGSAEGWPDEQPVHSVYLDAFYIDRYEVTYAQYDACVMQGACESTNIPSYFEEDPTTYANHPVRRVSWDRAVAYCAWRGARLPTEAEWEKAASWDPTTGGVTPYPWGDAEPNPVLANVAGFVGDSTSVGLYPDGASPVGALDMIGNAQEWVSDWYAEEYYSFSPAENPAGPPAGLGHVLRGGGWDLYPDSLNTATVTNREYLADDACPDGQCDVRRSIGFRCARTAEPE